MSNHNVLSYAAQKQTDRQTNRGNNLTPSWLTKRKGETVYRVWSISAVMWSMLTRLKNRKIAAVQLSPNIKLAVNLPKQTIFSHEMFGYFLTNMILLFHYMPSVCLTIAVYAASLPTCTMRQTYFVRSISSFLMMRVKNQRFV